MRKPTIWEQEREDARRKPGFLADLLKQLGVEEVMARPILPGTISPTAEAEVRRLAKLSTDADLRVGEEAALDLLRLMATVGRQQGMEYGAVLMSLYVSVGGSVSRAASVTRTHRSDPEIEPILNHMKLALLADE